VRKLNGSVIVTDASFEDGAERPLRLMARDKEDLQVLSALIQDAIFPATEMTWDRKARRFALLLNRFRWEDADGTGRVVLNLAGDGAVACDVETLEVVVKDVTRPYVAPSGKAPSHPA